MLNAQIDTAFWFAVPEVDDTHGDDPILLRLVPHGENAFVTVSVPAAGEGDFPPIEVDLDADEVSTLDITAYKALLENDQADVAANKGLYIHSTANISVYYEESNPTNADVFSLKGSNGLGSEFYACFQNYWNNKEYELTLPWNTYSDQTHWGQNSWSSFDIVAVADSTFVTILPTHDVVSSAGAGQVHPAGEEYTVMLDMGQTYSGRAASQLAGRHLSGTKIASANKDKPIAVTLKDDALIAWGAYEERLGGDLVGDQLIPVSFIGSEYIVLKGAVEPLTGNPVDYTGERVFVTATQNNTVVSLYGDNGKRVKSVTMQDQETSSFVIDQYDYVKISSTKNIYVFHVSGLKYELGGAVIPPLNDCSGSRKMSFTKSYKAEVSSYINNDINFRMNLMVRKGAEGCFTISGEPVSWISADDFKQIDGTDWLFATFVPNHLQVEVGETYLIENSCGVFHLGILNSSRDMGNKAAFYGYFSSFYSTDVQIELLNGDRYCEGDTVYFSVLSEDEVDLSGNMEYVSQLSADTFMLAGMPAGRHEYRASVVDGCSITKTEKVRFYVFEQPDARFELEDTICFDSVFRHYSAQAYWGAEYKWTVENASLMANESNRISSIRFDQNGDAVVRLAVDNFGCTSVYADSVHIVPMPVPVISLQDSAICQYDSIVLDASVNTLDAEFFWYKGGANYLNRTDVLRPEFIGEDVGRFSLVLQAITENTCRAETEITVEVFALPVIDAGVDSVLYRKQSVQMQPLVSNYSNYTAYWMPEALFLDHQQPDAQTVPFVSERQMVYLSVTEQESGKLCHSADSLMLTMADTLFFVKKNQDTAVCYGDELQLWARVTGGFTDGYTYRWYINGELHDELTTDSASYIFTNSMNDVRVVVSDSFDELEYRFTVKVNPLPEPSFSYSPFEDIYPHSAVKFVNTTVSNDGEADFEYFIDFNGNGHFEPFSDSLLHIYDETGVYKPSLRVVDAQTGCFTTVGEVLDVEPNPVCSVVYPNTVVVGEDGDDYFSAQFVRGVLKENYQMKIYNRWGQLLYQTTALNFKWDCIFKSEFVTQDVYVYQTTHVCENGKTVTLNGDLTVLK